MHAPSRIAAVVAALALGCGAAAVAITVDGTPPGARPGTPPGTRVAAAGPGTATPGVRASGPVPRITPASAGNLANGVSIRLGAPLPAYVAQGQVGLSFESQLFNEGAVAGASPSLVALLRTLHPGQLRVGADTGDAQGLTKQGLARLAALAKATSTPVVLGLPLLRFDPTRAATLAAAAEKALGPLLIAVEVGNESDAYGEAGHPRSGTGWSFSSYLTERDAYTSALRAQGVRKPVWGPDNSRPGWLGLTAAAGGAGFAVLTPHFYALRGCSGQSLSMESLLGGTEHQREEVVARSFASAGRRSGRPVVLGETNSGTCGGENGVSDKAGSALWAADLALLMARSGVVGLNFHVGLAGCNGYNPVCNPSPGPGFTNGWRAAPSYSGLLLPRLLAGGQFLALKVVAAAGHGHNVRFYAATMPDGHLRVVGLDLDPLASSPLQVRLPGATGSPTDPAALVGGFQVPDYTGTTVQAVSARDASLSLVPGQAKVWDFAR